MLVLVVNSIVVALGSGLLAQVPSLGRGMRIVALLVLAQAWITLVLLLSGVGLHRLDAATVSAVNLGVALLVLFVCRRHASRLAVSAGAVPAAIQRAIRSLPVLIRRHPAVAIVGLVVTAGLAWKLVQALRLPVLDFDGFSYHLVTVDVWLQSGGIGRVPQRIWSDGYPANGELITLWLMAFTRSDVLANLTALLAVPVAMAGTAGLARTLGASRERAVLAGFVIGGTPAVLALSASTYVDIWAMADVAAAACFGAVAFRSTWPASRAPLVLTGIAIGLAVGTKASMAIPMAAIAAVLAFAAVRGATTWCYRGRVVVRAGLLVTLPALVSGGYWYAKNLAVFGDPFWPFHLGPFRGVGDFGMITQTPAALVGDPGFVAIIRSWFADVGLRAYQYDTRIGGFGVVWAVLLVLAVVGIARVGPTLRPYVAVLGGAMLVTLLTMPMGWWPRLTLFVVVLVVALAGVGLSRLPGPATRALVAVVVVLTSWSVAITAGRSNLLPLTGGQAPPRALDLASLMAAGDPLRVDLGLWATCSTVTGLPTGSVVAADGFSLVHAVVGHELERTALAPIAMTADATVLASRLRDARATHMILGPQSIALQAATDRPDMFQPLGATCRDAHVFAVSPAP